MNSIKTTNILLIILLVAFISTTVWSLCFVNTVAEVADNKQEEVKNFLGTKKLAKKILNK